MNTTDDLIVMPQQLEAETQVLGALMLDQAALAIAQERLSPTLFYLTKHQRIFTAMLSLGDRNEPIDCLTLSEELRKVGALESIGGSAYLAELVASTPSAANVKHHADLIQQAAYRRAIIKTGHELVRAAGDPERDPQAIVGMAEQAIFGLSTGQLGSAVCDLPVVLKESLDVVDRLSKRTQAISGIPTGFTRLDALTAGWQDGDLIVLAARPSMGKTSLALDCARAAAEAGHHVVLFSLEMSRVQIGFRLLSASAHVNAHAVRTGQLSRSEWPKLAVAAGQLERLPMAVDDVGQMTVTQLRGKARRLKLAGKADLVIVDYLQLLHGRPAESRQQEIAEISRSLKLLAKELSVPVIALSQLSRSCESRTDKRPILADLRDSGAIEQDADLVLFIYRDEVYDPESEQRGTAEVLLRKHRNGPIGEIRLAFLAQYASFGNLEDWSPAS